MDGNKKYYVKIYSKFLIVIIIILLSSIIISLILKYIFEINIISLLYISILIIALLYSILLNKSSYFKLDEKNIKFYRLYPYRSMFWEYKNINSITLSGETLKNIKYNSALNSILNILFPMKIKNIEEFIRDLKNKYKNATGKELKIIRE